METQWALNDGDVSPTDSPITLDDLSGSTRDLIDDVETEVAPVVPTEETVPTPETEQGPIPYVRFKQVNDELVQAKADAARWKEAEPWNPYLEQLKTQYKTPEAVALALRESAETSLSNRYRTDLAESVRLGEMEQETADRYLANYEKEIRAGVHAPEMEAQNKALAEQAQARQQAQAQQVYNAQVDDLITAMKTSPDSSQMDERYIRALIRAGGTADEIIAAAKETHAEKIASTRATASAAVAQVAGVTARLPRVDSGRTDGRVVLGEGPDPLKDREGYEKHHAELMRQARIKPG